MGGKIGNDQGTGPGQRAGREQHPTEGRLGKRALAQGMPGYAVLRGLLQAADRDEGEHFGECRDSGQRRAPGVRAGPRQWRPG